MAKNDDLGQIINGCQKGDSTCFSQIVDLYSSQFYRYFYRLTGDRDVSDDLLSELFVKLVEKICSYRGGSFEGWLFKIASNIFHDYLRSKQRHAKLLETQKGYSDFRTVGPKISDETEQKVDVLQQKLKWLDEDTKELVIMRFYSELSFKEIAMIRSEPIGTTLSKFHRGIKKLRQLIE